MGTIIRPADRADAGRLARRLLAAAGSARHAEVRTVGDGPLGVAFDVPDDLAVEALGVVAAEDTDGLVAGPEAAGDDARAVRPPADGPGVVSVADSGGPPGKTSRRSRR